MNTQDPHIPVMLDEVLASIGDPSGRTIIDGTFGAGGYSRAFVERGARVIAFDRDPDAARTAQGFAATFGDRFAFHAKPFSLMAEAAPPASVDAVVLDVGVSSMQLDQAGRGFSFMRDGPLDMRMAQAGPSAADVVNNYATADLIRIIGILGEDRQASRIAHAIVAARDEAPLKSTGALVSVIEKAAPKRGKDKVHPATRTFQGLRIFVNDELRELARALFAAETLLTSGGRLVVVSFHSLEDRIVKLYLANRANRHARSRHLPEKEPMPAGYIDVSKAVTASDREVAANPRARSAKLRSATRSEAAPRTADFGIFKLPSLPWIDARSVATPTPHTGAR